LPEDDDGDGAGSVKFFCFLFSQARKLRVWHDTHFLIGHGSNIPEQTGPAKDEI
jgi:hypothetical protein